MADQTAPRTEHHHRLFGHFLRDSASRGMTLLLLVYVLDYADRALIGALGPILKSVFHINNAELGLLVTAFSVVSALATIPLGILTDRTRRTWLLAVSLLLWLVAEGLTGASIAFGMLLVVRMFLGFISAASGPAVPSLIGDIVPSGQRSRSYGKISTGSIIGLAVGFVLPAIILGFASWRWCFWFLAFAGLLLAVGFFRMREPQRSGAAGPRQAEGREDEAPRSRVLEIVERNQVTPSRRAMLTEQATEMSYWDAFRYVLRVRTDVIALIARSIGDFFFQAIATFAIVFATAWYHISIREADVVFLVIGIGALAGVLALGWLGDLLLRREWLNSRLWIPLIAYVLAPFVLYPAFTSHSLIVSLPLFAVGAFLLLGAGPPLDAVRIDVVVPRLRGRAESVRQVLRTIAEGGAPILVGWLSGFLAGGGTLGLYEALVITLPALFLNGLILLLALRTYSHDVAAAIASNRFNKSPKGDDAQGDNSAGSSNTPDASAPEPTPASA